MFTDYWPIDFSEAISKLFVFSGLSTFAEKFMAVLPVGLKDLAGLCMEMVDLLMFEAPILLLDEDLAKAPAAALDG